MRYSRSVIGLTLGLGLMVSGCGSGTADDPPASASTSNTSSAAAPASSTASATPTSTAAAAPTGTLSATPLKCTGVKLPAGLERANASPEVMCAFESATDYVSFRVGTQLASTFKIAAISEQANSDGKILIEEVPADGWTFGARWPAEGPSLRVQRWLVDAKGQVLLCKMGSDRGDAGIEELVAVCEQAKTALFTA